MVGTAVGGPVGGFVGAVIGAGLGQITTNLIQGRPWDEGLLFNIALAAVFEGVGTATGAVAGKRIRGQLDADVAPEPSLTRRPGGTQEVEWVNYGADEEWYPRRLMLSRPEETADWRPHRILDIGPGYDPEGPRLVELQEGRKLVSSLEALHNRYPNAQLGAVDVKERVITGIREDYVCTGRLPESTKLMHYEELGYLDPRVLREYGRSDLVVCIAPPPSMIYEAGGPVGFVRSLQNLTEPGGRVYVAIDPSTLESIGRSRFEAAFWEIAGAKPAS